jgi:hypothetical protein
LPGLGGLNAKRRHGKGGLLEGAGEGAGRRWWLLQGGLLPLGRLLLL